MALSSEDGNPHEGKMDFLDNQVNPKTGTIRGRAVFDNKDGIFTPGLYVRLKLVASASYVASLDHRFGDWHRSWQEVRAGAG